MVSLPATRGSDAELLEAVAEGSEEAFVELRGRYRRAFDRICDLLLGRQRDQEDCVQEAFVRVWQKAPQYDRGRGSGAAWLLTVARSVAHNLGVKRVPEPWQELAEPVSDEPALEAIWVRDALARLEPNEHRVLELAYFDDLSQSQIARQLDVPVGTVKSWTRRGLHRLADLIVEEQN
jgi:RNA polymerase sigma-70 factor (ECF subfamily)